MLLSICIPTHNGRGWCLKAAIEEMLLQIEEFALEGEVEICVSDNASTDETANLMAVAQDRAPRVVQYVRMPMDCGVYNFLNVVRVSRGEYCWLFGSDDIPAPGSLKAAVDLLKRYPECSGFSCQYQMYDFAMVNPLPGRPDALFPVESTVERQFGSFSDALVQLGPSQTFMSVQCFRRELWDSAIRSASVGFIYLAPHHTHTYVISRIIKADPRWVWTPQRLVRMRCDNAEVYTLREGPTYNHMVMVLREMTAIWSEAAGPDRALFRSVLRKCYRIDWGPSVIRHHKMLAKNGAQADADLMVNLTRYLASLPEFWYVCFPCLLIPSWFWKFANASNILPTLKRMVRKRS